MENPGVNRGGCGKRISRAGGVFADSHRTLLTFEGLDDPAAQDAVALIEDQRLAGTQGLLRFCEFDGERVRCVLFNPAGDCRRGIPVLDVHLIQGLGHDAGPTNSHHQPYTFAADRSSARPRTTALVSGFTSLT